MMPDSNLKLLVDFFSLMLLFVRRLVRFELYYMKFYWRLDEWREFKESLPFGISTTHSAKFGYQPPRTRFSHCMAYLLVKQALEI